MGASRWLDAIKLVGTSTHIAATKARSRFSCCIRFSSCVRFDLTPGDWRCSPQKIAKGAVQRMYVTGGALDVSGFSLCLAVRVVARSGGFGDRETESRRPDLTFKDANGGRGALATAEIIGKRSAHIGL